MGKLRGSLLYVLGAASLLLIAGTPPAHAELYKNVDCSCDPKTEARPIPGLIDGGTVVACVCTQSHTLGKVATMEFRFRCKSPNANTDPPFWFVRITERDKPTTCTAVFDTYGTGYLSQSCTNWSTLSTDTVKLQVACPAK